MLAPYGGARSSEGGAQAPGASPLDTPLCTNVFCFFRVLNSMKPAFRVTNGDSQPFIRYIYLLHIPHITYLLWYDLQEGEDSACKIDSDPENW